MTRRWTAQLLALSITLTLGPAQAQDFVPFDDAAPEPALVPLAPAPAPAAAEAPEEEAEAGEAPADDFVPPPLSPPIEELTPAPPAEEAPPAPRVIGEELVEEKVEPIGASALAPATRSNGLGTPSNDRVTPSIAGPIGLPQQATARVGRVGSVRLGMTGEVFALDDFLISGDHQSRESLTFAVAWTPLAWLEGYGSIGFVSATNTLSAPVLLQVMGDTSLGAKAIWQAHELVSVGLDLRLGLFSPIGESGIGTAGVSPRALATFDARSLGVPLLAHLETGFFLDGTGTLPGGSGLDRVEEFALGIHRHDRFSLAVGLEAPLPWVTPFAAWRLRAPLGEVALPEVRDASGATRLLTYGEVVSNVLTLGVRVTALRDVSFLLAGDLGLSGAAVAGVPATMPWNLLLGVSYTFDPLSQAERVTRIVARTLEVDRPVETAAPRTWVEGVVRDASGAAVEAALVQVEGQDALPVATEGAGRFRTHDLAAGPVRLAVSKTGYAPAVVETSLDGAPAAVEVVLQPVAQAATLVLSILNSKKKATAGTLVLEGPRNESVEIGPDGRIERQLPSGTYRIQVSAPGHLIREKDLVLEDGSKVLAEIELAAEEKRLVVFKQNRLELKRQIHFQTGKADILPDSYQLLDQVMDLIAKNHIDRIRIEGHTDSQGSDGTNLRLSQARAEAVRTYLMEKGLSPVRVDAVGHGESKPVAPNLTARGRAMNRRVEFHVIGS